MRQFHSQPSERWKGEKEKKRREKKKTQTSEKFMVAFDVVHVFIVVSVVDNDNDDAIHRHTVPSTIAVARYWFGTKNGKNKRNEKSSSRPRTNTKMKRQISRC